MSSARYWDRTSDLFRVREARYRCANRAQTRRLNVGGCTEVETGFEPAYTALQAAASPLGHPTGTRSFVDRVSDLDREVDNCERTTGVEPATLTMAR